MPNPPSSVFDETSPLGIIFLHIAKTGGTTIRSYFGQFQRKKGDEARNIATVRTRLSLKMGDFERSSQAIQRHLKMKTVFGKSPSSSSKILFVEFHGQGLISSSTTSRSFPHHLKIWKQIANEYGSRLFTFTLWRHPASHAISYYHHLLNHTDVEGKYLTNSPIFSRQCSTLSRLLEHDDVSNKRHQVDHSNSKTLNHATPWDGLQVYQQVLSQLDWIGTTESIDNVTIPLLNRLVNGNIGNSRPSALPHQNVGRNYINHHSEKERLDPTLRERILLASCVDYTIWKEVACGH